MNIITLDLVYTEDMGQAMKSFVQHIRKYGYCNVGGFFACLSRLELVMLLGLCLNKHNVEVRLKLQKYIDIILLAEGYTDILEIQNYTEVFDNFVATLQVIAKAVEIGIPINFMNVNLFRTELAIVGSVSLNQTKNLSLSEIERVLIEQFRN